MVLKIVLLLFLLTYEYLYSHAGGANNHVAFDGLWGKWGKRQTCEGGHAIKVNISELPVMWLFV